MLIHNHCRAMKIIQRCVYWGGEGGLHERHKPVQALSGVSIHHSKWDTPRQNESLFI